MARESVCTCERARACVRASTSLTVWYQSLRAGEEGGGRVYIQTLVEIKDAFTALGLL